MDKMKPMRQLVFDYHSYSEFLNDYIEFKKSVSKHWSISSWANRLGLSTTSSLTNIIQGRRLPSVDIVNRMCESMKELSDLEKYYFGLLVELERNKEVPSLMESIKKRIASIKPRVDFKEVAGEDLSKVCNWPSYTVREMVNLKDFKNDPQWISAKMNQAISEEEVGKALECLLSVGLLVQEPTGELKIKNRSHETTTSIPSEVIRDYHKSVLSLAAKKIDEVDVNERHFSSGIVSVRKDELSAAKFFLDNVRREFTESFGTSDGDDVYLFNLQFFPVTGDHK